ncbi:MAG: heme-binding domain-containing protein [Gemmatimonadota bacterium]|nr:MAG: heme-binding domain-containing protein [Gemmatimonadota bacterium]
MLKKITLVVLVLFVVIQFVPVDRENPPVEQEIALPGEVASVVERACYNCHSHETDWPWYGYVAPVSWLVADHVHHAREHVNFSTWNRYDAEERLEKIEEIWEEVDEGAMPPWYYKPVHPEARLSDADRAAIRPWVEGQLQGTSE